MIGKATEYSGSVLAFSLLGTGSKMLSGGHRHAPITALVFEAQVQPLMRDSLGGWRLRFWEEIPPHTHILLKRIARPKGYGNALLPPTEPPHWGIDETKGLLEQVAGENASLRCPARGEVEPRVGLGKQALTWFPGI